MECNYCPFECGVDRQLKLGVCKAPAEFTVAKVMAHFWEEPCISGQRGSGTVFFAHCNAACLFCQNYKISQLRCPKAQIYRDEEFIELCRNFVKETRVHNLNLVSPTHYAGRLLRVLPRLKQEISPLPIVWNSNGYEKESVIEELAGLVDVFLPDFKYADNTLAVKFSRLPGYFEYACRAIAAMKKVAGDPLFDQDGIIQRGVIIRHLILPGQIENSKRVLAWIAENLGTQSYISLMSQYYPVHRAAEVPELNRQLTEEEYREVEQYLFALGFESGFLQDLDSNSADYTPQF